jgi:hypothetical protein
MGTSRSAVMLNYAEFIVTDPEAILCSLKHSLGRGFRVLANDNRL